MSKMIECSLFWFLNLFFLLFFFVVVVAIIEIEFPNSACMSINISNV